MSNVDTSATTLPGDLDTERPPRSWRAVVIPFAWGAALVGVLVAGFFVRTPWVAIRPGNAFETEPRITVSGTEVFPSEGEILLMTISTGRHRMSAWQWAWAEFFEPDVWIVDADRVFRGLPNDERREIDLERMRLSQGSATLVALSVLGYDVFDEAGALVTEVAAGAPADGLLAPNDVIVGVDGRPIENAPGLVEELTAFEPGDEARLAVRRGDTLSDVVVELGRHPDDADRPFLGVALDTQVVDAPLPFEVEIDTGAVGGPSAGTAITLGLLDLLTEGDLTGGRRVAVTGEIALTGCIGNIGGLPQKAIAARDSGADLFIVPAAQLAELDGVDVGVMEVVGASGLDDALAILAARGGDTSGVPQVDFDCP